MSLYAVENDAGEYLDGHNFRDGAFGEHAETTNIREIAENAASREGGHVVELVEKPERVEVQKNKEEDNA